MEYVIVFLVSITFPSYLWKPMSDNLQYNGTYSVEIM